MASLPLPIETERLTLRSFEARDREYELAVHGDPALFLHLPIDPRTGSEVDEMIEARLKHQSLSEIGGTVTLVIETVSEGNYVGGIQLTPTASDPLQLEIGWLALRAQQGQGYISEAVGSVLDIAFGTLNAHRVVAGIIAGNEPSVRLAERFGFKKEAHFVKSLHLSSGWRDQMVYSVLAENWAP